MHVVYALRALGHDVVSVRTDYPGIDDYQVVEMAREMGRVILTFDKGFGDLAFEQRMPMDSGILLFRIRISDPNSIRNTILAVIESRSDWSGHLSVVEEGRLRIRRLPGSNPD